MRRAARFLGALALAFCAGASAAWLSPRELGEDFDAMWRAIDADYAYFGRDRSAWKRAGAEWRAKATRARDRGELVAALEGALAELGDDHASLSESSPNAPRRLATETDIWARWRGGEAVVEAVRTFSDADVAGLRPGQQVTKIQGVDIARAVEERLRGKPVTAEARDRALRQLLGGPRQGAFRVEVRGGTRPLLIEREARKPANGQPLLARRMGEERDLGYIRIRDAGPAVVDQFDAALNYLKDTRGLILDLRESQGPGSRCASRAILGRFVASEKPWQVRAARSGPRTIDTVPARADPYAAPILVLVDRWTAGEGEALAAGLAAVGARLVGTEMAGLRGELREARLPHSGLVVRFPAEKTFLPDGTAREALVPHVPVDLAAPSGGPGDPILYQALKLLERK